MNYVPRQCETAIGFFTYEDCYVMNRGFAAAMLRARRNGAEHFTIGPLKDHTALRAAYFPTTTMFSPMSSSA